MALADKRPLGVPVTSHASPAYTMKSTISDLKGAETAQAQAQAKQEKGRVSESPGGSPTSRLILPDSLMQQKKLLTLLFSSRDSTPAPANMSGNGLYLKKHKVPSRVPIATGISTTIPVTGEKPKPQQEGDASLEDDVLYAIFLILYEKDPAGAGMTVKQICDVLVERHPEMAQLSSKTSNLVSAKLNAYVKRVEKGDANLRYALSREWADALPKRMVYVYRGLLAKNFHVHLGQHQAQNQQSPQHSQLQHLLLLLALLLLLLLLKPVDSFEAAKHLALLKPRRQTMFDLGISRPAFVESPIDRSNLFVPYALAPVAASLTEVKLEELKLGGGKMAAKNKTKSGNANLDEVEEEGSPLKSTDNNNNNSDDFEFDELEVFDDDDDDDMPGFVIDTFKNGKRSKSMSYLSQNKKAKFLTAAAAAPRASKAPCSPSPNAAAAAAALHAAALKAIAAANSSASSSLSVSSASSSGASPASTAASESTALPKSKDWLHVVRLGFLSQEIGAPEDISLLDLDKLFS